MLARVHPALLLAELPSAGEWPGWSVISEYRAQGIFLPVMVIAEGRTDEEAVAVFEAGGNEYMKQPLHTGEFRCRVLNLLLLTGRRRGVESLIKVDGLLLDPSRRLVSRDGIQLSLTPKEFDLLYYLAVHQGEICPRDEILRHVWGYHFQADTNVVDVYIRHVRQKVDKGHRNKLIHTVRGTGYVLRAPDGGPVE
ncbi:Transcriptional regulatory protein CusR [compost metagenome]